MSGSETDCTGRSGHPLFAARPAANPATSNSRTRHTRQECKHPTRFLTIGDDYNRCYPELGSIGSAGGRMMTRRELGKAALAGIPLSAAWQAHADASQGVRLGVATYSFREMLRTPGRDNVDDVIRALQFVGAKEIRNSLPQIRSRPDRTADRRCRLLPRHILPRSKHRRRRKWRRRNLWPFPEFAALLAAGNTGDSFRDSAHEIPNRRNQRVFVPGGLRSVVHGRRDRGYVSPGQNTWRGFDRVDNHAEHSQPAGSVCRKTRDHGGPAQYGRHEKRGRDRHAPGVPESSWRSRRTSD